MVNCAVLDVKYVHFSLAPKAHQVPSPSDRLQHNPSQTQKDFAWISCAGRTMRIILPTQEAHTGHRERLCLRGGTDPRPGMITDDWEAIGDK